MGFNYTIIIYIIVLSGLIYAIFIAIYFEAKLSHQSNKAKANIFTGVFISLYTLTGLASLLSSFSNSMIIRYGFPTLFAAEQLVGIIFFLRYFRETRRWLNKNNIFKENLSMEILETKGRKMNKIKREEREDLHTFSDTTNEYTDSMK